MTHDTGRLRGGPRILVAQLLKADGGPAGPEGGLLLGGENPADALAQRITQHLAFAQPAGPPSLFGGLDMGDTPFPVEMIGLPASPGEDKDRRPFVTLVEG